MAKTRATRKHIYAIYGTFKDGTTNTFNVSGREDRDLSIKNMIEQGEFKEITWCRIYANGEYSRRRTAYFT